MPAAQPRAPPGIAGAALADSRITGFSTHDVRFPTSARLDGSDAMNPNPDYSAAYLVIETDEGDPASGGGERLAGHASVFTIGRGTEVQVAAIRAGQPLWQLLAGQSPDQIADLVDFRYLTDALTRDEALDLLERGQAGRDGRAAALRRDGFPAYSTTPGWLGYSDDNLAMLSAQAVEDGFTQIKLKVGVRLEDDKRRFAIARKAVGDDTRIAIDANQVWEVPTAISWVRELAPLRPAWIEEPTSPRTSSGWPPSGKAYSQSRWLPASMSPTGWYSSSCCRHAPSTSCRSTPAGWRA